MPLKMCVCNIALNISGKSKVVKEGSRFSSFMNQIYFELDFVFLSPHCKIGTVSIHTSNEFNYIYQFLLLCDHMLILCQWICLDAIMWFLTGFCYKNCQTESCLLCHMVSISAGFVCTVVCLKPLLCKFSVIEHGFYKHVGRSYGKLCSVFYLGHFNATRNVAQVRYHLPLWHCVNAANFSHNHHLYSGTCASGKMVNQIP
jgi:hypothetical protein